MFHSRVRQASLAATLGLMLAALPAAAFDWPPSNPNPPASSSGGSSSSGGDSSSGGSGSPTPIPEPAAIGLFALGIAGAYLIRRRNKKKDD